MSVKVVIAETFQTVTGGTEMVEVQGKTVGRCLEEVVKKFPGIEKMWYGEKGQLAHYILIFVNGENVLGDNLMQPVKDGDEIYPMLIIGGG